MQAMNLRVEQVNTESQFTALHEEWNNLLCQSANNEITLTWEWMYTWWGVFKDDTRRLMILTVRDLEGRLVGIAPLQIRVVKPYCFLSEVRQLAFLAFGEDKANEICSDYLNLIIFQGREAEVISRVLDYLVRDLSKDWDEAVFDSILADSENALQLKAATQSNVNMSYQESIKGPCRYIPLPKNWDNYLATKSNSFRKAYRYYHKTLALKGKVTYEDVSSFDEFDEGFNRFAQLHQKRWVDDRGRPNIFLSEKFRLFHRQFSRIAFNNGWFQITFLCVDGTPIAAVYNFTYNKRVYNYQSGIDTDRYKNISSGILIHGHSIQKAISNGMTEYDFLFGHHPYKKKWTNVFRNLATIRVSTRTIKMRTIMKVEAATALLRNGYRWCKSLAKKA